MKTYRPHASSVGDAAANLISMACYVSVLLLWSFGIIPIVIIFLVEKKSGLVRFHSMQALLLWVVSSLFGGWLSYEALAAVLTGDASYLYSPFSWMSSLAVLAVRGIVSFAILLFGLVALVRAYRWQDWRIPFLGQLAALIVSNCAQPIYNGEGKVPHGCERGYTEAGPEWKPKWQTGEDSPYQQMLPPPPEPLPVEEALQLGHHSAGRLPPRAAPLVEPATDVNSTAWDAQAVTYNAEPPKPAPQAEAPPPEPKPKPTPFHYTAPIYDEDELLAGLGFGAAREEPQDAKIDGRTAELVIPPSLEIVHRAMDYDANPNDQLPDYMRDPDPVTEWMEDPLPDYPVTPGAPIESRRAAPVPQNVYGARFGKKPRAKPKPRRKKAKDDPNDQLPSYMRDGKDPYDMY